MEEKETVPKEALFDAAAVLCWVCDALANESDGHVANTREIALCGLRRAQDILNATSGFRHKPGEGIV